MAQRALLIAAETFGLRGCQNDVDLMVETLDRRGFTSPAVHAGKHARRAVLIDAFDALIASTQRGDAVVVYYSGHGGRMPHPDWEARQAAGLSPHIQFLVPTDIEASAEDDFRGLLAEELSAFQARLTDATDNVTMILDCCHSAFMARDTDLQPKAISTRFPIAGIVRRLEDVGPERLGPDTNRLAVRVVACQAEQSAYERQSDRGRRHGVLTDNLVDVLDELGGRTVTWATIGDLVRRRVQATLPQQRPDVEGPVGRLPFSEEAHTTLRGFPVVVDRDGAGIAAAAVLGVAVGDRFRLVTPDAAAEVGTAVALDTTGGRAALDVTLAAGIRAVPDPCDAVPTRMSLPPLLVRVDLPDPQAAAMLEQLATSPLLAAAAVAAVVVRNADGLVVEDANGRRAMAVPAPDEADGRRQVVGRLERRARADRLRSMASGDGVATLDACLVVEFETHVGGAKTLRRSSGECLREGEGITIAARNTSPEPRWVWLFDIGIDDEITLLTPSSGHRLEPAGQPGSAARIFGRMQPQPLQWGAVPRDGPWPEQLLVIVADSQQDLAPLATGRRDLGGSPLDALLDEVRTGTRNLVLEEGARPLRYRVERIGFELEPSH